MLLAPGDKPPPFDLMHTVYQSSHDLSSSFPLLSLLVEHFIPLLLVEIHSNLTYSLPSLLPAIEYPR